MLCLGKHDYSMDERGRVPMPPRFREALLQGIILTQGSPDACIRAYPSQAFESEAAQYMDQPVTTQIGRIIRRAFFSNAYPAELDKQGRVLIPPVLRQSAALDGQVVVVGTGEAIEIWDAAAFDAVVAAETGVFRESMGSE
jgi:MraZ protein